MKRDLCLRFETEAAAIEALASLRRGGRWVEASHTHALDVIGPLVVTPATFKPGTLEVATEAVVDTGFHVNLRTDDEALADSLAAFAVTPATRRRVWA